MSNKPKIKITPNGPYLVSGKVPLNKDIVEYDQDGVPLKTIKGQSFPPQEDYALCRCGHSKNMPFCDGSHLKVDFNGAENPLAKTKFDDQIELTNGPDLTLKDAPSLCAGAGFCHRDGGVWELTQNSDNPDSKKIAVEECHCCPSGRLIACDKKSGKDLEPKLDPSIGIPEDGPLCVKGDIPIESVDGSTYEVRHKATLCRCGKSRNKPFCDGSHFY
jgi:CDGSH-type Zn-finger protein